MTCDTCKEWSGAQWEAFFVSAPVVGAVTQAFQALPFPLCLRPFLPPPWLLRKLGALRFPLVRSPLRQRGVAVWGESESVPRVNSREVSSPPFHHSVGEREREKGGGGVLASGVASDSAASSLPGVGVAGSSCSQESLVLAAPSSVASSASADHDSQLRCCEVGGSIEDCSRSHSSRSFSSRGRDFCGERRCARLRSEGSRDRSCKSCSCFTNRLRSRGCGRSRRDSSRSPSACLWSQQSRSRSARVWSRSDRSRSQRVHLRSSGCCEAQCDLPVTGLFAPFPPTVRGLERGVDGLGRVSGIERRLLLPPGIAATLGRGWSLPLW